MTAACNTISIFRVGNCGILLQSSRSLPIPRPSHLQLESSSSPREWLSYLVNEKRILNPIMEVFIVVAVSSLCQGQGIYILRWNSPTRSTSAVRLIPICPLFKWPKRTPSLQNNVTNPTTSSELQAHMTQFPHPLPSTPYTMIPVANTVALRSNAYLQQAFSPVNVYGSISCTCSPAFSTLMREALGKDPGWCRSTTCR